MVYTNDDFYARICEAAFSAAEAISKFANWELLTLIFPECPNFEKINIFGYGALKTLYVVDNQSYV